MPGKEAGLARATGASTGRLTSRCTCRLRAFAQSPLLIAAVRGRLFARPQVSGHPLGSLKSVQARTRLRVALAVSLVTATANFASPARADFPGAEPSSVCSYLVSKVSSQVLGGATSSVYLCR
jgi:hypothetical protein